MPTPFPNRHDRCERLLNIALFRLSLSNFSGILAPLMDKSLFDDDADNVFVVFVQNSHDIPYWQLVIGEEITNGDFPSTGSKDAAFPGLVKTFVVTRKPFRFKGSGSAMAKLIGNRENRKERSKKWEEVRHNREPAGMESSTKPPRCMGTQKDFRLFRRAYLFLKKSMKKNDASTHLRLYPHTDGQSRLSQQVTCRMALVLSESCCKASIA